MDSADGWFICRVGSVEVSRPVGLTGGASAVRTFHDESPAFGIIEVDQDLVEHASTLALKRELRSLDTLHLAAALALQREELLNLLPDSLD